MPVVPRSFAWVLTGLCDNLSAEKKAWWEVDLAEDIETGAPPGDLTTDYETADNEFGNDSDEESDNERGAFSRTKRELAHFMNKVMRKETTSLYEVLHNLHHLHHLNQTVELLMERDPAELLFYLPQIVHFVLTRPGDLAFLVEQLIGEKCKQSQYFGISVYYALKSHADSTDKETKERIDRLMEKVEHAVTCHQDSRGSRHDGGKRNRSSRASSLIPWHRSHSHSQRNEKSEVDGYMSDGDAVAIAGNKRRATAPDQTGLATPVREGRASIIVAGSTSTRPQTLPVGIQPITVEGSDTGSAGDRTSMGTSSSARASVTSPEAVQERRIQKSDRFHAQLEFLEALTDISAQLKTIPPANRKAMMIEKLEELNTRLPDDRLYIPIMPFGTVDVSHQVLQVARSECIVISTKERAPFMCFMEIAEKVPLNQMPSKRQTMTTSVGNRGPVLEDYFYANNDERVEDTNRMPVPRIGSSSPSAFKSVEHASVKREESDDSPRPESTASLSPAFTNMQPSEKASAPLLKPKDNTLSEVPEDLESSEETRQGKKGKKGKKDESQSADNTVALQLRQNQGSITVVNDDKGDSSVTIPAAGSSQALEYSQPNALSESLLGEESHQNAPPLSAITPSSGAKMTDEKGAQHMVVVEASEWARKQDCVKEASPYGHVPGWGLMSFIVKAGDDIRQEEFAMQLIAMFDRIFTQARVSVWLKPYRIISTGTDAGLIEVVNNAQSIDGLKKAGDRTLPMIFKERYGSRRSRTFLRAERNFVESMAGYSIVCYLLQIKDRHNGNILLTNDGHIVHIDFGFLLGNSPGAINFERAPFKLTVEMLEVMGGPRSMAFQIFRSLCVRGFMAARKRHREILLLVQMMMENSKLPCLQAGNQIVEGLRQRFMLHLSKQRCRQHVMHLIDESIDNWRTRWYDSYQRCCVGIF